MTTQNDFSYLASDGGPDFELASEGGFKTITWFNCDTKYRNKTVIRDGGWGIPNPNDDAPPIGEAVMLPLSDTQKPYMISPSVEVSIIGWTKSYIVVEGTATDQETGQSRYIRTPVPNWISGLPEGLKMRSGMDLFLMLRADDSRSLYRVAIKNHDVIAKTTLMIASARMIAARAAKQVGISAMSARLLWLSIGPGESFLSGKKPSQSLVTPLQLTDPGPDYTSVLLSRDDVAIANAHADTVKKHLDLDPYYIEHRSSRRRDYLDGVVPGVLSLASPARGDAQVVDAEEI